MKKTLRLAVCAVLCWTLQSDFAWSAFVIDSASVTPATVAVGVATPVTIIAVISEPLVLPDGVNLQRLDATGRVVAILGTLRDDGTNGDAVAGDGAFTIRTTIFEQVTGPVRFRVSAAFRGRPLRALSSPLTVNVTVAPVAGVTIGSPSDLAVLNSSPVNVAGTVGDPAATVTVNGIPAGKFGSQFQASVPLVEGANTLTAVATNTGGTTSTASVQVTLDTTPPQLTIASPADNLVTTQSSITVTGTVSDVLPPGVTVNGLPAAVANGSFAAANVPLALGLNTILATARDRAGNSASISVHVTRNPVTPPSIRVISGNNQSGPVSSVLPAPLVVALDDGAGGGVANTLVVFRVTDNDGLLTGGGVTASTVAVTTNASGQAQVTFQLGSRAGTSNNRVEATATGFTGTAVFSASGLSAVPSHIVVDSGQNQTGTIGTTLALPFVAIVTDAGHNRLGGVPVTFVVREGGGSINSSTIFTTNTDPDGRAAASLTLGPQPGLNNNVVEASFPGNPGLPATFVASAAAPADTDGDGILDSEEITPGADGFITNPVLADSDGDGVRDGLEIASGSDPSNPASLNLGMVLQSLQVDPANFSITINSILADASTQLTVTGQLIDGTSIDLTSTLRGTNYASNNLSSCNPGPDGRVSASSPGSCTITIDNSGFTAVATGTVTNFTPVFLSSIAIPGYANNVDVNGGFAYVAAGATGLQVVSVSNPSSPVIVAAINTPGNANDVRVVGSRAYVADGPSGLQIVDVSNPLAPALLGALDTPGEANDVMVSGDFAYVADGVSGLQIIDVSDPAAPTLVRTVDTPGTARGVDIEGSLVVVADDATFGLGLVVIDASDPATAAIVGSVPLTGQMKDVDLADGFAYVAALTGGVHVVDVHVPTVPVRIGGLMGAGPSGFVPRDVEVAGQFALFAEQLLATATAPIVDISTPGTPVVRGLLGFVLDYAGTGIAVNGPYVYWTGEGFVVTSENGSSGTTRLFIGQYLSLSQ